MANDLAIVLTALKLSEGVGRDFTDLDLAKASGQEKKTIQKFILDSKNAKLFRRTPLTRFICPVCNVESERYPNGEAICKKCGTSQPSSSLADFHLSLQVSEVEKMFRSVLISELEHKDYTQTEIQNDLVELSNGKERLFIRISAKNLTLNDYFVLRGWHSPLNLDVYLLFCYSADEDLIALSQKDPRCILIPIENIHKSNYIEELWKLIDARKDIIRRNSSAESVAKLKFEDYFEIDDVKHKLDSILTNLPKLARQQGNLSSGQQGIYFQKYIVSLLNLTLFRVKYLGGRDEPDGIIQLLESSKKPTWVPIEIKSFKPKKNQFFEVKDVAEQLDKYSKAFEKQDISERISVPAFLTIAFDFDLCHGQGDEIVNELERNHSLHYSFMPLDSVVHLLKLFLEKKIYVIPNDVILDFLKQDRLITKDRIDVLFKNLEEHQKIDSSLLSQLRKHVAKQGV